MRLFVFFLLFLLSPYVFLLINTFSNFSQFLGAIERIDFAEIEWALKNSIIQAFLSALVSLITGFILFQGLQKLRFRFPSKSQVSIKWLEVILILPNLMPTLLIVFLLIDLIEPFPTGIPGIVLVHAFINSGLVAILIDRAFQSRLLPLAEIAHTLGASRLLFYKKVIPLVSKDMSKIFALVFVVCFASFSVPLLVGGGKATTLEILMYEKLKLTGNYGEALVIGLLQLALISFFGLLQDSHEELNSSRSTGSQLLGTQFAAIIFPIFTLAPFIYLGYQAVQGIENLMNIEGLDQQIKSLIIPSLLFSLSVSLVVGLLILLACFQIRSRKIGQLMASFISPSTAFLGLFLLLALIQLGLSGSSIAPWIFWVLGISYLIFPILYRWGLQSDLESLRGQIEVAQSLGAQSRQIYFQIVVPQIASKVGLISSVAGFWALGDFAFGKILIGEAATLAMLSESLMTSYRIKAGLSLMGLVLIIGFIQLLIIRGGEIVYRYWFNKKVLS